MAHPVQEKKIAQPSSKEEESLPENRALSELFRREYTFFLEMRNVSQV